MVALGFDFHHGRLDVSAHPFCGGIPDDVRITTRYDEADFLKALMGVLHETGHALYERGLPAALRHQPAGEARGMAVHESQSLIVEMQACRSREFTGWMAPLAQAAFGGAGPAWSPDNIRRLVTRVARGLIRVDANEIAYPLHVILRFRLERAILSGELALADLPAAWNDGMAASVGVRPDSDREGCLQDIHWYDGAFGYFPTYTFGALMAAQLSPRPARRCRRSRIAWPRATSPLAGLVGDQCPRPRRHPVVGRDPAPGDRPAARCRPVPSPSRATLPGRLTGLAIEGGNGGRLSARRRRRAGGDITSTAAPNPSSIAQASSMSSIGMLAWRHPVSSGTAAKAASAASAPSR